MIAIDTNILVRYFVGDDPKQFALAKRFIEEELSRENAGFVSLVALAELSWVLVRLYDQTHEVVLGILRKLLDSAQIVVEEARSVEAAMQLPHDEMGDALIHEVGRAKGCDFTITFDKKLARLDGIRRLA